MFQRRTRQTQRAVIGVLLLGGTLAVQAPAGENQVATGKPRIEMVFAIDTTSSMTDLIQAAKTKVWSIVNKIASGKPTPDIRVGLVAYRDLGDTYVTQITDLTVDLDAMYGKLMGFAAEGGGDTPESVNQALFDAVNKISWSQGNQVLRIIFLVGDAPPHMDYPKDVKYPDTCQQAVKKGININTIRCGSDAETEEAWKKIAHLAEGSYFSLAGSGGVAEVATPYDDDIARTDRDLRATVVFYGGGERMKRARGAMKEAEDTLSAAPAEAKAERAAYAATAGGPAMSYSDADLIKGVEDKTVSLDKLSDDQLPEEMRKLSKEERVKYVQKKVAERQALQKKLDKLSQDRAKFIADQSKKAAGQDAFDGSVIEAVREKAKKIGVSY